MNTITPDEILSIIEDRRRLLFLIGAGVSKWPPSSYPLWNEAVEQIQALARNQGLADEIQSAVGYMVESRRFYDALDLLEAELLPIKFDGILQAVFGQRDRSPNVLHNLLAQVEGASYMTTNFDKCLEGAVYSKSRITPRVASYTDIGKIAEIVANDDRFVVKLHGDVDELSGAVISRRRLDKMAGLQHLERLFTAKLADYQLIVLGYGMNDPDFDAYWNLVLQPRTLRHQALVCSATGDFSPERVSALAESNIRVLEFDNTDGNYGFLESVLRRLAEACETGNDKPYLEDVTPAVSIADDSLILELFGANEPNRFQSLLEALCLEHLASVEPTTPSEAALVAEIGKTLGLGKNLTDQAVKEAVRQLIAEDLVRYTDSGIALTMDAAQRIRELRSSLQERETTVLREVLHEVLKDKTGAESLLPRFRLVIDEILLWLGEDLARQVLFSRFTAEDMPTQIASILDKRLESEDANRGGLEAATNRLLFDMRPEEEDWFFQKVQAHFLVRAHILHPKSEALLRDFAAKHVLYLDSSVVLPMLAAGHPLSRAYGDLIARSRKLGVTLSMTSGVFSEVVGHINIAIRQFLDLEMGDFAENLQTYNLCTGEAAGNVFLEGLNGALQRGDVVGWKGYLRHLTSTTGARTKADKEIICDLLENAFGICVVTPEVTPADESEIARLENAILRHRPNRRNRYAGDSLTRHEATLLFAIKSERNENPELAHFIWFLTTDTHIAKLQLELRDEQELRLPVAYNPARWSLYLNTVDFRARGSGGFAALMKKVQFGPLSGRAAIDLIKASYEKVQDTTLRADGARMLKDIICQFHSATDATDGPSQRLTEEQFCEQMKDDLDKVVVKHLDEIEDTERELAALKDELNSQDSLHNQDVEKYKKQIGRLEHHISILKAKLRPSR